MLKRYIVVLESVERWLHCSEASRGALVTQIAEAKDGFQLCRQTKGGKAEPYAVVRFMADVRVLTWEEHEASGDRKPVFGMEPWYDGAPAAEVEPPVTGERPKPVRASSPPPARDPEPEAKERFNGAGRKMLRVIKERPGIEAKELAQLVYGGEQHVARARAMVNNLRYARKQVETVPNGRGYQLTAAGANELRQAG